MSESMKSIIKYYRRVFYGDFTAFGVMGFIAYFF